MTGDRYAFRQRFNRWKQGERYWSIIGRPLPHYADGKDAKSEFVRQLENTPTILSQLADYNKPLNGGMLNEIVVTPTEDANWLFSTGRFKYNQRKPLGDKHTRKVISNYLSKFDNERAKEYNDRITRLADVLDVNGMQFVENNADPDRKGRAYFVGGNKKTAYVDNMRDIFAEISHPWQYTSGNNDMMEEVTQDDYNNDIDPRGGTRYAYPDTFEGETHGFFEPTLTEYVTSGKIGKSSPVINKKLSKKKIVPKDYFEVLDSAASWDRQAIDKRIISMPDQLPLSDLIKYSFVKFPLIRKNNGQKVLPQYRGGKNSKSSFVQQLETQPTVLQSAVQEWGDIWKERMEPAAKSKVLQKWNATGRKPKPETSQEYTNRRIKETTERTWRSDAADIAHGIGEGVLAINPYTAIPYYGAKVGQDVLSGNVNWNTALNASVPLFHLSPQAVGLREATNAVLEDAANAGSKTARNWRIAREINQNIKNTNIKSPSRYITKDYNYNDDGSVSSILYQLHDPISGKPLGNGVISSPYLGTKGRPVGWIESQNGAKGVSEDIYNVAVEDAKTYGDLGIESGWDLMEPKKTLAVTNKFPHIVVGESEGHPVRLLTGITNKQQPYFIQQSNHHLVNNNIKYNLKTGNFEEVSPNIINGDKTSLKFFERKPSKINKAEKFDTPTITAENAASITPENAAHEVYSIPSNYDYRLPDYYSMPTSKLKQLFEDTPFYDPQKFNRNIDKFYQNNIEVKEKPIDAFYRALGMDKRFKFIPPSKLLNYDVYNMTAEEAGRMFGPSGELLINMLDIAKAHNFEGKYGEMAKKIEKQFEKLFPISKEDPDIALGLERSRRLYSIPEYRQRFNRFGTLGETFIDDALDRLDNVRLQGIDGDFTGGTSMKAAGSTTIDNSNTRSPLIKVKNTDSSTALQNVVQHEGGHASHGLEVFQPAWMKRHNESIKPKLKPRYQNIENLDEKTAKIVEYQNALDEIVTRSKTAVEYADRTRLPGESLDDALERVYKMAERPNAGINADITDLVWYFDKETLLNFWKNFVGSIATPVGIGYGLAKQKSGKMRPIKK